MAISKVILNGETLMDVTSDTVASDSLLTGKTATKNDGTKVTGNYAVKLEPLTVKSTDEEQVFDGSPQITEINGAMLEEQPMDSGDSNTLTSSLVWRSSRPKDALDTDAEIIVGQKYHLSGWFGTGNTEETSQRIFFDTDWVARETPVSIPFTTKPGASDDDPSSFDGSIEFTEIKLSSTEITITATAPFVVFTGLAGFASKNGMYLSVSEIREACDGYIPVTVKPMRLASLSAAIGRSYYADEGQIVLDCSGAIESITDQIDCDDSQLVEGEKYRIKVTLRDEYGNYHYIGKYGDTVYITWDSSHTIDLGNNSIVTIEDGKLSCNNVWPFISLQLRAEIDGWNEVLVEDAQLQSKTVSPSESAQTVTADSGYYGLYQVTVNAMRLQEKTVTPTESQQIVIADYGNPIESIVSSTLNYDGDEAEYRYISNNLTSSRNGRRIHFQISGHITYKSTINKFDIDTTVVFNTDQKIDINYTENNGTVTQLHIAEIYIPANTGVICFKMDSNVSSISRPMIIDDLNIYDLDNGTAYTALKQVTVNAIPSTYIPRTKKQINFIDYDGTILYSYTFAEWQDISELPSNPSHDGLTAQGWNWTKAEIDAQLADMPNGDVWIGQMYITDDGKTRIYIHLEKGRLHPYLGICPHYGTVVIDWGDNSSTTSLYGTSLTTVKYVDHEYASDGDYIITLFASSGDFAIKGGFSYSNILKADTSDNNKTHQLYNNAILKIEIGQKAQIGSYSFVNCRSLQSVTIPNSVTSIGEEAFKYCYIIRSITIPNSISSLSSGICDYCSGLESIAIPNSTSNISSTSFESCDAIRSITIPNSVTSIKNAVFNGCMILLGPAIPSGVTTIQSNAFYGCRTISNMTIPNSVTSIEASAFANCYGMAEYHIKPTTPPTLGTTVFNNISSDCVIYVPLESLEAYQTAENWSEYASYMQGE